jgi:hypothetical protein
MNSAKSALPRSDITGMSSSAHNNEPPTCSQSMVKKMVAKTKLATASHVPGLTHLFSYSLDAQLGTTFLDFILQSMDTLGWQRSAAALQSV